MDLWCSRGSWDIGTQKIEIDRTWTVHRLRRWHKALGTWWAVASQNWFFRQHSIALWRSCTHRILRHLRWCAAHGRIKPDEDSGAQISPHPLLYRSLQEKRNQEKENSQITDTVWFLLHEINRCAVLYSFSDSQKSEHSFQHRNWRTASLNTSFTLLLIATGNCLMESLFYTFFLISF